MKTFEYLLYDDQCALCKGYTNLFIRYKFIQVEHRIPYHMAAESDDFVFDRSLAKSRIALVQKNGGPVYYGIDSLLHVLGNKWRLVEKIGSIKPIWWILNFMYLFVSYNRKIISPAICTNTCDCSPEFSSFWRWTFILFSSMIVNGIMFDFFNEHFTDTMKPVHLYTDFIYFGAQLIFLGGTFLLLKQKGIITYLGHIAMISLMGALLIWFGSIIFETIGLFGVNLDILYPIFYGAVLMFMFYEHKRRLKIIGATQWMSIVWLVFRIALFPIAFYI